MSELVCLKLFLAPGLIYRFLGDTVNIIGSFETSGTTSTSTIDITSKLNYLILHPDILITATALSSASQCRRKPLLSGLVHSSSDMTPALVWGSILHEVMQLSMSENCWQQDWIEEKIDEVIRMNLMNIVRIDMTLQEASREVKARAKGLIAFADKYLGVTPKVNTDSVRNQIASIDLPHNVASRCSIRHKIQIGSYPVAARYKRSIGR